MRMILNVNCTYLCTIGHFLLLIFEHNFMSIISPLKVYSVGFNCCKDREQKGACFRKKEMKKKRLFCAIEKCCNHTHVVEL